MKCHLEGVHYLLGSNFECEECGSLPYKPCNISDIRIHPFRTNKALENLKDLQIWKTLKT
jgi:hypothetical protein